MISVLAFIVLVKLISGIKKILSIIIKSICDIILVRQ